jgi:hypothetical protein
MRKRPKKVVVYEKYSHFFMVYEILTVKILSKFNEVIGIFSDYVLVLFMFIAISKSIPRKGRGHGGCIERLIPTMSGI